MSPIAGLALVVAMVVGAQLIVRSRERRRPPGQPAWQPDLRWCPNCGSVGEPRTVTKGSMGIEALLWLCFLFPGLLYSIWRLSTRHRACPSCGAPNMVPVDSPRARAALQAQRPPAG